MVAQTRPLSTRVPLTTYRMLEQAADETRTSVAAYVANLIEYGLAQPGSRSAAQHKRATLSELTFVQVKELLFQSAALREFLSQNPEVCDRLHAQAGKRAAELLGFEMPGQECPEPWSEGPTSGPPPAPKAKARVTETASQAAYNRLIQEVEDGQDD